MVGQAMSNTRTSHVQLLKDLVFSEHFACEDCGISLPEIEPSLFSFNSPYGACPACNGLGTKHFWSEEPCPVCKGARLRPEALNVFLGEKTNVVDVTNQSIADAFEFFDTLELSKKDHEISKTVIKEITARLKFMLDVGLDYLTLDR